MGIVYGGLILGAGVLLWYYYRVKADILTAVGAPNARRVDQYAAAAHDDIETNRADFNPFGEAGVGLLSGALGGFSYAGPIGAVVGAIVGGVYGLVSEIVEQEHGEDIIRQTIATALRHDKLPATSQHINYVLHQMLLQQYAGPLAYKSTGELAYVVPTDSQWRRMEELQAQRHNVEQWAMTGWASSYFLNLVNYVARDYGLYGDDGKLKPTVKGKLFRLYWYQSQIRRWTGVPYLVGEHMDIERRPTSSTGWTIVQPISDRQVERHMLWWGRQNGIQW